MKDTTIAGVFVAALSLSAVIVGLVLSPPSAKATEFVCYDDGKLVERHVEVDFATHLGAGAWRIGYRDGQKAIYQQDAGETCQLEDVR
jgi:hypothetical protein